LKNREAHELVLETLALLSTYDVLNEELQVLRHRLTMYAAKESNNETTRRLNISKAKIRQSFVRKS